MSEGTHKELTPREKGQMVSAVIVLMSVIPMIIGMVAITILDHFNVRELHEQGDIMAWVWILATITFIIIGLCFSTQFIFHVLRRTPGMRESFPAIWEDDNGEPLPQPEEPKPMSPKVRKLNYWLTLVLMTTTGVGFGVMMASIGKIWRDFLGYAEEEAIEGLDGIIYNAGMITSFIACILLAVYILHLFLATDYGTYIKPYLKDPKDDGQEHNGQIEIEEESGVDNE